MPVNEEKEDKMQVLCTVEGKIRYMPIYMAMFLQKDVLPEKMIYDIGAPVT